LRVWVAGPAGPRPVLLADLIRRAGERRHLRVTVWQQEPADWAALNIHHMLHTEQPPDPLDVAIAPPGLPVHTAAHRIDPAETRPVAPETTGLDPLALRLALLEHHYSQPAVLARPGLEAAAHKLQGWREDVAAWAASPSRPLCAGPVADVLAALEEDLDTPAALRALSALAADGRAAPGARFESFAYLDAFLGLDLARDVGR
jgi:hypothetical protein